MKLQVALDYFTIEEALKLMDIIHPYVEIAEIGSPLIYAEGFRAIRAVKEKYPHIDVLADMKIVDGGYPIADAAFAAGADIVTSIGMTNDETLKGLVKAANEHGKKAMADTIGVANLEKRVQELEDLGFEYLLVHTAHDMLDCINAPIEALKLIKANVTHAKVGISGGITVEQMPEICAAKPDWIVVGSSLTLADDPLSVAKTFTRF